MNTEYDVTLIEDSFSSSSLESKVRRWLRDANVDIINISYTATPYRFDSQRSASIRYAALICFKYRNL